MHRRLLNFGLLVLLCWGFALSTAQAVGWFGGNPEQNSPWGLTQPQILSQSQADASQLEQQGRQEYELGNLKAALEIWQKALEATQKQSDILSQAQISGYLALVYSQLGQWQEANTAIATSLYLLRSSSPFPDSARYLTVFAETHNIQGTLHLAKGQPLAALSSWESATSLYEQARDATGVLRGQINQSRALQALGFYPSSCQKLVSALTRLKIPCQQIETEDLSSFLQRRSESLTPLQVAGWLSLGDALRQVNRVSASRFILETLLSTADEPSKQGAIWLSLGKTLEALDKRQEALSAYEQAIAAQSTLLATELEARLARLNLLIQDKQWEAAIASLNPIDTILNQLPSSHVKIYAQINFSEALMTLSMNAAASANTPTPEAIARLLESAHQQARALGDTRGEIYALGNLGKFFEQTQQWTEARQLTEQALLRSQAINAPELSYLWRWQLGRILAAQGQIQQAIATYVEVVNTLQSISQDLVANPAFQVSFQTTVEPVYREALSLLLPRSNQEDVSQADLSQARDLIESLQVAQLNNFFRDICLESQPINVEDIDPSAALVYPIVLSDRLVTLVSLPNQPLQFYVAAVSQAQLEMSVTQLRYTLVIRSQREFFGPAQQIYDWLIRPFEGALQAAGIKTLVFVPDGNLRNVPMSALHDRQQYLIERYQVALTPSLTLLSPQPLQQRGLNTLFAGLSKTDAQQGFAPLAYVEEELLAIASQVPSQSLLNQQFTPASLQQSLEEQFFPIVHLATHGQFSSQFEDTYILAWNSTINIRELERLLKGGDPTGKTAIELLVLSACETAAGDRQAALGLAGFAVRAGARSTVATLWSVNDQATAELMGEFYRQLATQGISKAEALRQTQLTLLNNRWYKHPFYWSPFVLVGNWL